MNHRFLPFLSIQPSCNATRPNKHVNTRANAAHPDAEAKTTTRATTIVARARRTSRQTGVRPLADHAAKAADREKNRVSKFGSRKRTRAARCRRRPIRKTQARIRFTTRAFYSQRTTRSQSRALRLASANNKSTTQTTTNHQQNHSNAHFRNFCRWPAHRRLTVRSFAALFFWATHKLRNTQQETKTKKDSN